MARTKYKCFIIFVNVMNFIFVNSLPIVQLPVTETKDTAYTTSIIEMTHNIYTTTRTEENNNSSYGNFINSTASKTLYEESNTTLFRQTIRPEQTITHYDVLITKDGNNFNGVVIMDVRLSEETKDDPIILNVVDLDINKVFVGVLTNDNLVETSVDPPDDGLLEISPPRESTSYVVVIEYSAEFRSDGTGLHLGELDGMEYISMNLHPTYARRVFPCMDEPDQESTISFNFTNFDYNNIISNTMQVENTQIAFQPLITKTHLWGMVAHNFIDNVNLVNQNIHVYTRSSMTQETSLTFMAISNYMSSLEDWTLKPYVEITSNQNGRMHITAVPDISREWYALSTVCIWEPYMIMGSNSAYKHRKIGFVSIAKAMARQWFGYVMHPESWEHQWFISGFNDYVAYEIAKEFHTDENELDETLLDMDTIFTTEIIQEGLFKESYSTSTSLLYSELNLVEEKDLRLHFTNGMKYKAPALLKMFSFIVGGEEDVIKLAARAWFTRRSLEAINTQNFYEALLSIVDNEDLVEDLKTWVNNQAYPIITVSVRPSGALVIQEHLDFTQNSDAFAIPITYTTSINPNFNDFNSVTMIRDNFIFNFALGDEDWVIFNLKGQGYYRVNYEEELWERLIDALSDPDRRNEIHPLNRASLIDDALNLARHRKLSYDIALQVVLTMEHETEYAVWLAFVRNMDFIRKYLIPHVLDNELDEDIYLRMISRTIEAFEDEIGFNPLFNQEPAMLSLTRGLVMDHACRSGYDPCIAAAVDLFYEDDVVNPNIPPEIRPAVYCTMASEGDDEVIEALKDHLEIENNRYERLVILESLACSKDGDFIDSFLRETIDSEHPYVTEERLKIFIAIANSNVDNAQLALNFMTSEVNKIREMYGGDDKLEEAIAALADNMVTVDLVNDFRNWANVISSISNLDDSEIFARRAVIQITENLQWSNGFMDEIYEWIDENNAPTLFLSSFLICITVFISLFNY